MNCGRHRDVTSVALICVVSKAICHRARGVVSSSRGIVANTPRTGVISVIYLEDTLAMSYANLLHIPECSLAHADCSEYRCWDTVRCCSRLNIGIALSCS